MKWKVKVYIYATQFICLNILCCFLLTLNHMQPVCQYIVTQGRTTTYDTCCTFKYLPSALIDSECISKLGETTTGITSPKAVFSYFCFFFFQPAFISSVTVKSNAYLFSSHVKSGCNLVSIPYFLYSVLQERVWKCLNINEVSNVHMALCPLLWCPARD